mmetsp:Transcript_62114/g.98038  ORF Transcript_62114/g.98038 Transcript_62114/m.98038 type:complete len:333 (-) Transcript_62114:300-1298(-)
MAYFNESFPYSNMGLDAQQSLSDFSMSGDFYMEPNDTTRGVTLDVFDYTGHLEHDSNFFAKSCVDDDLHTSNSKSFQFATVKESVGASVSPAFRDGDEAPSLPVDDVFQLERTTIPVQGMSAAQTANSVMFFLNDSATSRITKVNNRKFTIKAEIIFDSLFCEVKARVYGRGSQQYCVEVQRRNGDAIAFDRWYRGLSQHMSLCCDGVDSKHASASAMCSVEGVFLEVPSWEEGSCVASLEPLLNLAEYTNDRTLQAEAVLALAQAAQNMDFASQICTPQVIALLNRLAAAAPFSIIQPLSRLVGSLVALPHAAGLLELQNLQFYLATSAVR